MSLLELAKQSWGQANKDNIGLLAAGVAFYGFLALVPMLAALVLSYGLFADPADAVRQAQTVVRLLPPSAAQIVIDQMTALAEADDGRTAIGLLVALATAVYGATKGAKAVLVALNIVNDVEEMRGFLGRIKASLLITLLLVATSLLAFAAIALLGYVESLLPRAPGHVHTLIKWLVWMGFAAVVTGSLAFIYRYGPARRRPGLRASVAGAVLGAILTGAGTLLFALYVANFGSYNATYGALGAVVILQLWLYLSAWLLLLGAEIAQSVHRADQPAARVTG